MRTKLTFLLLLCAHVMLSTVWAAEAYFLIRQDFRKCASPMCGGYFVQEVNRTSTRCPDGKLLRECYVPEIDVSRVLPADSEQSANIGGGDLVQGYLDRSRTFPGWAVLVASEAWDAASDVPPTAWFYRVRDTGVRCARAPCLTLSADLLNVASKTRQLAGVDFTRVRAGQSLEEIAFSQLASNAGLLAAGKIGPNDPINGPILHASQFYLKLGGGESTVGGACYIGGCSGQVCSDTPDVITTCEWSTAYVCYQDLGECKRQQDGRCGWTQTPALQQCLSNTASPISIAPAFP